MHRNRRVIIVRNDGIKKNERNVLSQTQCVDAVFICTIASKSKSVRVQKRGKEAFDSSRAEGKKHFDASHTHTHIVIFNSNFICMPGALMPAHSYTHLFTHYFLILIYLLHVRRLLCLCSKGKKIEIFSPISFFSLLVFLIVNRDKKNVLKYLFFALT